MQHPRHLTIHDDDYLDYIREQDCCILGCQHKKNKKNEVDPHHSWHSTNDYLAIPMCRYHHGMKHTMPDKKFELNYNVNLQGEVIYFLFNYKKGLWLPIE